MQNKNYGYIDPDYLKPELSTKLYRTTYKFIAHFYSKKVFDEVCNDLKIPKAYLLDDDNWVSVSFGRKFAQAIKAKTADPEIYRKIGHFFFDPENINPIENQILKTISPFGFFKTLPGLYSRTNLACELNISSINLGHYEIEIRAKSGTVYSDMMLNTLGVFEALQEFYKLKSFKIEGLDSTTKTSELSSFRFTLKFSWASYLWSRFSFLFLILCYGIVLGLIVYELQTIFKIPVLPVVIGLNVLISFFCYSLYKKLQVLKNNITHYHERSRERNFQLYQKTESLDRSYKEAQILRELSEQLIEIKSPQEVVDICLHAIEQNFSYKKTAIFLVSEKRKKLFLSQSRGFEKLSSSIGNLEFDYPGEKKKDGFFAYVLAAGRTALVLDVEEYKKLIKIENQRILDILNVGSMIISPIQTKTAKYGVLAIIREAHEACLTGQDQFLVENICNLFALYFENASNYQREVNLKSMFQRYVPRPVLEQLSPENKVEGALVPAKNYICSFFADIRQFTTVSETLPPEKVFELINEFSTFVTNSLTEQGVIIDNIIGDAVVAFAQNQSTLNTLDCRIRVLKATLKLVANWDLFLEKTHRFGLKKIEFGIGLNSGEASIGSVGSEARMNYTALGDTVNTASRIQALTKTDSSQYQGTGISVAIASNVIDELLPHIKYEQHRLRGKEGVSHVVFLTPEIADQLLKKFEQLDKSKGQAA